MGVETVLAEAAITPAVLARNHRRRPLHLDMLAKMAVLVVRAAVLGCLLLLRGGPGPHPGPLPRPACRAALRRIFLHAFLYHTHRVGLAGASTGVSRRGLVRLSGTRGRGGGRRRGGGFEEILTGAIRRADVMPAPRPLGRAAGICALGTIGVMVLRLRQACECLRQVL